MHSEHFEKFGKKEEELRLAIPQHFLDRLEYSIESWRPEETCCQTDSRERPLLNSFGAYPEHSSVEGSYSSTEIPPMYSTDPVDWAAYKIDTCDIKHI